MESSTAIPSLQPGECQVWWADRAAAASRLLPLLDDREQARLSRFRREEDRTRYLVAHATLRVLLAAHLRVPAHEVRFSTICRHCGKEHGKPRLEEGAEGIEFSLSHSGRHVVVALARDFPVGVDVEQTKPERDRASLATAVLSEAEQRALAALPAAGQGQAFLRYWTRKEALLKATGHGLAIAPSRLTVTAPGEAAALISWSADQPLESAAYLLDLAGAPGHVAALAALGVRPVVVERDAGLLLAAR
jgi:4'-phosphopantetheinyl transferase